MSGVAQMDTPAGASSIITTAREIAAIGWRHWRKLAVAFAIPPLLAILALLLLPNHYTATASVLVKNGPEYLAKEEGQVNGQAAPQVTKQEIVNSEVDLMGNPQTIEETITALGGVAKVYPSIAANPPAHGTPMDAAVVKFGKKLVIAGVKLTNIIDLSFTHPDQQMANKALQTLLDVYQRRHSEVYGGSHGTDVFQHDMDSELGDMGRLEAQLTQLKLSNGIYDIDQQRQSLIAQRSQAQDQLLQSEQQRATLTGRVAYLTEAQAHLPVMQRSTETDKLDGMGALTGSLVDLRQTESEQLSRYGADHPLVVATRNQIAAVQNQIDSAKKDFTHVKTDPNPLAQQVDQELVLDRTELAPLDGAIGRLSSDIGHFTAELQRLETADMQQRMLVSRISSIDENLKYLRTEYAKARASDDLDQQKALSVSVTQQPMTPGVPSFPNGLLFMAVGIVFGAIAASGRLVLMLIANDDVLTHQRLESATGLRVLAVLPPERAVAGPGMGLLRSRGSTSRFGLNGLSRGPARLQQSPAE